MAEEGDKKGDKKAGLLRVVVEGAAESMTKVIAEKGLAALFGGGTSPTPPPAPGAPAAPRFDLEALARDFLGSARRAELNAHAARREAELNNAAAALRSLDEDE